jgi:hypothetical protein
VLDYRMELQESEGDWEYIGTYEEGLFIWHVFQVV